MFTGLIQLLLLLVGVCVRVCVSMLSSKMVTRWLTLNIYAPT